MSVRDKDQLVGAATDSAATRSSLIRKLEDWNDQGSWQQFFDTYWKLIYAVAVKAGLSDEDARDIVQETTLAVAKQLRERGYENSKSSFKTWLCLITRRRIIDHLRQRTDPKLRHRSARLDTTRTDTVARLPDPASLNLDAVWDEEWQKNLFDAAVERVRQRVNPKHFQIFDLSVRRQLPVGEVKRLVKVSAAQVYLARHRVGSQVKEEVKRIEAQAARSSFQP